MLSTNPKLIVHFSILILFSSLINPSIARKNHAINFKSPNLFPESIIWDPRDQHFIIGSLNHPIISSVSDAGIVNAEIVNALPPTSFILGLSLHRRLRRILAVVHHRNHTAALACFDLKSRKLVFMASLDDHHENVEYIKSVVSDNELVGDGLEGGSKHAQIGKFVANDVAVDFDGNAYVTGSGSDVIWKVNSDGVAFVLSRSMAFKGHPVDEKVAFNRVGLNGVVYCSKGYLLVVQSNSGKLYKVNVDDGSAKRVILNKDLVGGDGIAMRRDGVVVVVSQERLYFLKSDDSWGQGAVFDETALEVEKQASGVAVGDEDRVYVLYGYVNEGMMGGVEREEFSIVEIVSGKEAKEDSVWVFVLIGIGLAYFMFWRFQMRSLVQNLNKKTR
ncbi:hypothetical protein LIER_21898 [Lithospermum erythrorhizon]|uniref:NHL repeat-containing protein n=1 Tax=Lithospermum erythrorhizon TaxID=34254 RepID=A0AAV3QW23_LITER